ncbi:hypothetical protein [Peribacillus asahii]|uniref:hypothetical protein n=1 Tax=Peribacillus asahii TaxID=228899 RepID=UPI00207AEF95|nr:hypothetical protein [Peribacillus asahii]USK60397.1 hypothetical protein LIT37_03330 [Peribacillus asahii]
MELILDFENNRGRYLCDCEVMLETKHNYTHKYKCRGCCSSLISGENESKYINALKHRVCSAILQQYSPQQLLSLKGHKLSYDIALFHERTAPIPFFLFEVLSYSNLCNSNQDNLRDNYIRKVLYGLNTLQVPLVEFGQNSDEDPESIILDSMEKYQQIKEIKEPVLYKRALQEVFYKTIINRIGRYYFKKFNIHV